MRQIAMHVYVEGEAYGVFGKVCSVSRICFTSLSVFFSTSYSCRMIGAC